MRINSVISYNYQPKSYVQHHNRAVTFCDEKKEEAPNKTNIKKIKEFLIDVCIAWVAIDILTAIWKYFGNKGPKI